MWESGQPTLLWRVCSQSSLSTRKDAELPRTGIWASLRAFLGRNNKEKNPLSKIASGPSNRCPDLNKEGHGECSDAGLSPLFPRTQHHSCYHSLSSDSSFLGLPSTGFSRERTCVPLHQSGSAGTSSIVYSGLCASSMQTVAGLSSPYCVS